MATLEPVPELRRLGIYLARSRVESGLSQSALAARCGLAQQQVSFFEAGLRIPTLPQAIRIARVLDIPIQRLITGCDRPGVGPAGLALELRKLGVVDLRVGDTEVPGSFRRPEEVINLAIAGKSPDPRIIEAIPAILAWNELDPNLLVGYARSLRTGRRLAWLADVALSIDRQSGFPGGCHRAPLERFLRRVKLPESSDRLEDLGKAAATPPSSPIWRRWRVTYDANLSQFRQRAKDLHVLRNGSAANPARSFVRPRIPTVRKAPLVVEPPSLPPVKLPAPRKLRLNRPLATRRRKSSDD